MSFFNWFFGKSAPAKTPVHGDRAGGLRDHHGRPQAMRDRGPALAAQKPVANPATHSEIRKAKRHARREQLYIAVHESLTRAGVLAASYKFKVLSLDQSGNTFLVMMDVDHALGRQVEKLAEIEAIILQTAKARYEILVTAVYWRMEALSAVGVTKQVEHELPRTAARDGGNVGNPLDKKPGSPRHEPIQDDEVAAFRLALAGASATSLATVDATGKSRSGPHSYTLLTGFEDTEMPESAAAPALSNTQYGALN